MKQYLSRQLWMLAILLLAGIGNVYAQTKTISVTWDNTVADVTFQNVDNWSYMEPNESGNEWELPSGNGKNYQMRVYLHNPMVYSINSVTIDNTDVTNTTFSSDRWGGNYMFKNLSTDQNVKILFDKVAKTNTISVNFDQEKGYVQFNNPENEISMGVGNGVETELPQGSTIRMIINPETGWQVSTVTVDGVAVEYNGNYFEFTSLSADHEVNIEYAAVETHTISVANYSEVANILNDIVIGGNGIDNERTSIIFNEGSNVTMKIFCRNNLYSVSISVDGGAHIPLEKKPRRGV